MTAHMTALPAVLADTVRWRAALAREAGLFAPLASGARIGLVAEDAVLPGGPTDARMLVWEKARDGMAVSECEFGSFEAADVDVLIAIDAQAQAELDRELSGDVIAAMRRLLRAGHLLFFARRTLAALEDAGYEGLLEQMGFAFLGACR
ncbi:MAG: hypothetical protein HY017_20320 [Betaproteobacteria bacterium]|nr:hypothetical protein [Betaproteobacteria bacterium]